MYKKIVRFSPLPLSHLRRGKLQLAKPHLVSSLEVEDVVPLALEEGLEGEDELEVGGGGDVVTPGQTIQKSS